MESKDILDLSVSNWWRNQLYERLCHSYLLKRKGHVIAEDDTLEDLKWDLRQLVVKNIGTSGVVSAELDYTMGIIKEDAYNRHAWSHRLWVLQTFGGDWVDEDGAEIEFCRKILEKDSCNSYAWDQLVVMSLWKLVVMCLRKFKSLNHCLSTNAFPTRIIRCGSSPEVRDAILRVLQGARDCVLGLDAVGEGIMCGSGGRAASLMNARGVMNALNMLMDIYENSNRVWTEINRDKEEKYRYVLRVLCPNSFLYGWEFDIRIVDRMIAILRHLKERLAGHTRISL
ncbi:protein farnesyltransferase/ geranylgeranyltransferase type-1 subunit alpha [Phtheirospermum japonicum]|uniref:Protein farnesyltransferase/ geranylgeranyltransferase type-1 subunit alpha n=1 Tax=Phtheirospermum japonicum TaxID=374723 RepID=A0A830C6G0_9LAMI|nr:protein farnesyltransferase/ geranylgeranyltransferase type-1 subunit alpha [Phtheirospermum japonicum]